MTCCRMTEMDVEFRLLEVKSCGVQAHRNGGYPPIRGRLRAGRARLRAALCGNPLEAEAHRHGVVPFTGGAPRGVSNEGTDRGACLGEGRLPGYRQQH